MIYLRLSDLSLRCSTCIFEVFAMNNRELFIVLLFLFLAFILAVFFPLITIAEDDLNVCVKLSELLLICE